MSDRKSKNNDKNKEFKKKNIKHDPNAESARALFWKEKEDLH